MFKKLVLIALLFISNVYATDSQNVKWTKRVKYSPALVKVFAAIVPCIVTFISMNRVMINHKDSEVIVGAACAIKWAAASIASIFSNLLLKVNIKKWIKRNASKRKASEPIRT
jgi:hypothetical protein